MKIIIKCGISKAKQTGVTVELVEDDAGKKSQDKRRNCNADKKIAELIKEGLGELLVDELAYTAGKIMWKVRSMDGLNTGLAIVQKWEKDNAPMHLKRFIRALYEQLKDCEPKG